MRFIYSTRVLCAALAGVLALGSIPPAPAQDGAPSPSHNFSDHQLKSFAAASEAIHTIGARYSNRIRSADNKQSAVKLRKEAQDKMIGAVKNEGLSVKTYSAIARAAQNDPQLLKRIEQIAGN